MKKTFWILSNMYGKLFGWSILNRFHYGIVNLSLHALGYGNTYRESWTGERWFVEKVLRSADIRIVFDVGANTGAYSQLLLKNINASIYAFEPNPHAYKKLLSLPEQVTKVNSAVGDYDGSANLYYQQDCDEKASLDPKVRNGNEVEVRVVKLETFIRSNDLKKIDYIKIDTEGYEKEVIRGLGAAKPRYIQFEFNVNHLLRNCTLKEVTDLLPEYEFYRLLPNGWTKIDPKKYINNIFIYSNYIAVKNK